MSNTYKNLPDAVEDIKRNWIELIQLYGKTLAQLVSAMKSKGFDVRLIKGAEENIAKLTQDHFVAQSKVSKVTSGLAPSIRSAADYEMSDFLAQIGKTRFSVQQKAIEDFHKASSNDRKKGFNFALASASADFNYNAGYICLESITKMVDIKSTNDNNSNIGPEEATWFFDTSVRVSHAITLIFDEAVKDAGKLQVTPINRMIRRLDRAFNQEFSVS